MFTMKQNLSGCSGILLLLLLAAGCASTGSSTTTTLAGAPAVIEDVSISELPAIPQPRHEGSLWQENAPLGELFMNPKARRVGDIVTIHIVERSRASNAADTKSSRNSSAALGLQSFLGLEDRFPTSDSFFNPFGSIQGSAQSGFDGKGATSRSGDLTARITARVIAVLPNGNLKISGSREIAVNNETQLITLSGIIRPRDVAADNVVLSTYIADARITYSGDGVIGERQRPGWLARLLEVLSPF